MTTPTPDPDSQARPADTIATASLRSALFPLFCWTAVVILLLDQLTKNWVLIGLPAGMYWNPDGTPAGNPLIPGFLYLVHIYNPGAAWGILPGMSVWLGLAGIVAVTLILLFHRQLELQQRSNQFIFGMITGGVLGNVIDRLRFGYVIDFIDVHLWSDYRWPAFNIADCGITVGVVLYLLSSLRSSISQSKHR